MQTAERVLSELAVGGCGRVVRLQGPAEVRQRLAEMGLTSGAAVRLIRTAPLGDPLELQVRGYRLSLRRSEAAGVVIEEVR